MLAKKIIRFSRVAALLSLLWNAPAYADETLDNCIRVGQEAEARGDLVAASRQYFNIACTYPSRDYGVMPIEAARLCGRRCLALQILLYKQNSKAVSANAITETYAVMRKLEPGNAAWPYLQAQWGLKNGAWNQCEHNFAVAANAPGPESIKQKARRDFEKYVPQIRATIAAEIKEQDSHFSYEKWNRQQAALRRYVPGDGSSTPYKYGKEKDSWHDPSNNAIKEGDYGAADRLLSGNGTSRDVGLYMH